MEFIYEVIFLSRFHYQENFIADTEVKIGLFKTIERMYPDIEDRMKVDEQLIRKVQEDRGYVWYEHGHLDKGKETAW